MSDNDKYETLQFRLNQQEEKADVPFGLGV